MSADTHTPAKQDPRLSLGPTQLGGVIAAAVAIAVAARFSDAAAPVVGAALIAALVPKGHGWNVRGPIAAMAGLLALFVVRMWPGVQAITEASAAVGDRSPPDVAHRVPAGRGARRPLRPPASARRAPGRNARR